MKNAFAVIRVIIFTIFMTLSLSQVVVIAGSKSEEDIGKEYAEEFEKEVKLVEEPAIVDRVNRIGQALAKIAVENEVPADYGSSEIGKFSYNFKVIEDDDINAISLPGGYVYVNSGLIKLAESDNELAAVIAHEIAHCSHHHMKQLLSKQASVDRYIAIVALAGILGNIPGRDLNNLLMGAQMVKIGKISSYTQEAEKDADKTAVAYLAKSEFDPKALLGFMRKLETKHNENPTLPLGIYQTHPAPISRIVMITKTLKEHGIKVSDGNSGAIYAKSVLVEGKNDQYEVVLSNKVLYAPAGIGSGQSSKERADKIAGNVNKMLESGIKPYEIYEDKANNSLKIGEAEVIKVEKEDIEQKNATDILDNARSALEYAVWADWLCKKNEMELENPK